MLNVNTSGAIQLTRGDTARFSIGIDNLVSGDEYSINGSDTLVMTIKKSVKDIEPIIQKVVYGSNLIHIEPSDTSGLSFGNYVYDVQLTTGNGDVYTIIPPNTFELLKEVTV